MRRFVLSAVGSLMVAGCSLFGVRAGYEQPAYEVVERLGDAVEIRRYAPRLAAETVATGADGEAAGNIAFRSLFDYISGANRAGEQVAMTVPVESAGGSAEIAMTVPIETAGSGAGGYTMRFFLPAGFTADSAPAPTDPRVRIIALPAATVAVRRFTGWRDAEHVLREQERLLRALEGSPWRPSGAPSALFYDPPWTIPFLRRNEVAVAVMPP